MTRVDALARPVKRGSKGANLIISLICVFNLLDLLLRSNHQPAVDNTLYLIQRQGVGFDGKGEWMERIRLFFRRCGLLSKLL